MPPCFLVQSPIFNSGVDHIIFATSGISGWNIPQEKKTQLLTISSFLWQTDKTWPASVKNTFCVVSISGATFSLPNSRVLFFCVRLYPSHRTCGVDAGDDKSLLENTLVPPDGQMDLVQMDLTVTTQTHTDDRPLSVQSRSFGRPAASLCFRSIIFKSQVLWTTSSLGWQRTDKMAYVDCTHGQTMARGALCGPLRLVIWPAEFEEIIIIVGE